MLKPTTTIMMAMAMAMAMAVCLMLTILFLPTQTTTTSSLDTPKAFRIGTETNPHKQWRAYDISHVKRNSTK